MSVVISVTNRDLLSSRYPGLAGLRLAENDFAILAQQGIIAQETSGSRTANKLRFRRKDGRQVVRYIRREAVAAVRRDLAALQRGRSAKRVLKGLERDGREFLRVARKQMQSDGARYGLHFHGRSVRKRRGFDASAQNVSATNFYLTKEGCMEGLQTAGSAAADRAVNDKLGKGKSSNSTDDDSSAKFVARLGELRDNALEKANTDDACRNYLKADLMKLVHLAGQAITTIIEDDPKALVFNNQISAAADRHIGYLREYNRFENLDVRIAEVRAADEKAARNDPLAPRIVRRR